MPCEGSQGQLSLLPGVSRGASASCSEPPDPRASPGDRPCRHRGTQVVSLESGESYWSSQTLGRDLPAWDSLEWMHSGHTTVSPLCGDWAPCPEQCELPDLCALGPRLSCRLPARALGTLLLVAGGLGSAGTEQHSYPADARRPSGRQVPPLKGLHPKPVTVLSWWQECGEAG